MSVRSHFAAVATVAALVAASAAVAAPAYKATGSVSGPDGGWDYATFDPHLRRLYVSHADSVFALDIDTGKVTPKLGAAPHGHKVVPLDGGSVLAVTVSGDNTLRFLNARTGAALGSVPTAVGPDSALLDPASGLLLVAAHRAGEVALIDPKARKAVGSIVVGGALEELATDGSGRVFVNVEDRNELVALDLKTRTVAGRLKLEGCDGPTGLVYAPAAHALVAACDGKAAVVDARTFKLEKLLTIGKGPDAALYDPKRRRVLIPCGQSGELAVIDASAPGKLVVAGMYPTEKSARLGALDPTSGKVYLPAARFGPPAPGARRGSMLPGSFHILVVSPGA
jgi:DNA-binding beta-propeller fold protein YncE